MDRVEARRVFDLLEPARRPEVLDDLVLPALERIGTAWERGQLSRAQVYMGARICEDLVDTLPRHAVRHPTSSRAVQGGRP
jgi:hypothetical protein